MRTSKLFSALAIAVMTFFAFQSCKKDKTLGTIDGQITDATTGAGLADVRIVVFNSNTNAPTDKTATTDANGNYEIEITEGIYYLRLSKQGYDNVPPPGITPVSIEVIAEESTTNNYQMPPGSLSNTGWISGKVKSGNEAIGGALVIANIGNSAYSSTTDAEGYYVIYNTPAGNYDVKAWKAGYNSDVQSVAVTATQETASVNLSMTDGASGSVNGQITFLATNNIEVDVALVHPLTKETIPGLSVMTVGQNYTISNVPDGNYIARASYQNDTKVVDPDWIIKNGEPTVTIAANAQTVDFSVTGSVDLTSPTNGVNTKPFVVGAPVTFSWSGYSSASDYVIEVMDANGNLIWGGFDLSGALPVKNITIPSSQTSIQFNSDGNASINALENGAIYRWRIYASKNAQQEATGWKLISVSEDQKGLIQITN